MRRLSSFCIFLLLFLSLSCDAAPRTVRVSRDRLMDKIKGAWAGQTIGCTYGGPTEFRYNGVMIDDSVQIVWPDGHIRWYYDNFPGLYDDVYMDLTFVDVFAKEGLDHRSSRSSVLSPMRSILFGMPTSRHVTIS